MLAFLSASLFSGRRLRSLLADCTMGMVEASEMGDLGRVERKEKAIEEAKLSKSVVRAL